MTPADRARARTEARRLLDLAAIGRRRAAEALDPGAADWEAYVADQRVQQARERLARVGETFEHLQVRIEDPEPLRVQVVHYDLHQGSGYAACGAEVWPRVRRDLSPSAGGWREYWSARVRGTACQECLGEAESTAHRASAGAASMEQTT